MSEDIFGLVDAEYWHPERDRLSAPLDRLLTRNFRGLGIGAPRLVPLDSRSTLPLLVGWVTTVGALRERDFSRQAVLTAVDRRSGQLYLDLAVPEGETGLPEGGMPDPMDVPGAEPLPDSSNDRASHLQLIDVRERLPLRWTAGSYLVTLILLDTVSNRVPVRLATTAGDYHDEEVERYLQREYARALPPAIHPRPGDSLPSYRAGREGPAVPAERGVVLAVDRATEVNVPDARCVLRGAFRLELLPRHIVRPVAHEDRAPALRPWLDATAVVDITLVITGSERAAPVVIPMHVPSFDAIDPENPPAEITGHFAIDLLKTTGMPLTPQAHFVYAFAGEILAGPVRFVFIRRVIETV